MLKKEKKKKKKVEESRIPLLGERHSGAITLQEKKNASHGNMRKGGNQECLMGGENCVWKVRPQEKRGVPKSRYERKKGETR